MRCCAIMAARGWAGGMLAYETLLLRELGYGAGRMESTGDWREMLAAFDRMGGRIERYLLADRRGDVMAARERLRARLARIPI